MSESSLKIVRGCRVIAPPDDTTDMPLRYGISIPLQIAPGKAALVCNVRRQGVPCVDFEVGNDAIIFDDLDNIDVSQVTTLTRAHRELHSQTGQPVIRTKLSPTCSFVPLGAKLADGTPHPHAGTGFLFSTSWGFAADFSTRLHSQLSPPIKTFELSQLLYDGSSLRVTRIDRIDGNVLLPGHRIRSHGIGAAIADGADLLWGMSATGESGLAHAGMTRWQFTRDGWRPTSFTPVTAEDSSIEGNVHRDFDGSLLFAARCIDHDKGPAVSNGIRLWRSIDGGQSWEQTIAVENVRASTPVVLSMAANGRPFICANPYRETAFNAEGGPISIWSRRQELMLWPIDDDRRRLLEPIVIRDTGDFGPSAPGRVWYADHAIGNTVQLEDGKWRTLLNYRVRENNPGRDAFETATPATANYIDEVRCEGEARPLWRF